MMNRYPVLIDTDTGVDDAIALLMACRLPQFDLRAVTSVAGNVEVSKTTINALRVLELAGCPDIPVYEGAAKPIFRTPVNAEYVHGKNGLGDLDVPMPKGKPGDLKAWDAIYEEAVRAEGNLTVIAIGPLTNLGLAFAKYRKLPSLLKRIVIMGGAGSYGNYMPSAEFNICADAEAADMVFTSGVPVYMCGLDVTMKAWLSRAEIEQIGASGKPVAKFVRDVTQGVLKYAESLGLEGMPMHDPCAVLYAADDSLFKSENVWIRVETKGQLTYGKTVTDWLSDKQMEPHNAFIVTDVDREKFRDRLMELIAEY